MDLIDNQVQKGISLYNLRRYADACKILEQAVLQEPSQFEALVTLCNCNIQLSQLGKILKYSKQLIQHYPNEGIGFYFKSYYHLNQEEVKLAITEIDNSLAIDPNDADYWALKANIFIAINNWPAALEYANNGLLADPEHINCLNFRTHCLTKLDKTDELDNSINQALNQNPYNSYTHANVGWSKLETKDYNAARLHFAEALRINPGNEYARDGLINAIKAKNIFFNWFLQYSFWLEKKTYTFKIVFVVLFIACRRILINLAAHYPWLYAVVGLALFFVFITWLIDPISNFFLLLDKFGKNALTKYEKQTAYITITGLGLAMVLGIAGFILKTENLIIAAIFCCTIIIVLNKYFSLPATKRSVLSTVYLGALVVAGLAAILFAYLPNQHFLFEFFIGIYAVGIVAFTWLHPYLFKLKN